MLALLAAAVTAGPPLAVVSVPGASPRPELLTALRLQLGDLGEVVAGPPASAPSEAQGVLHATGAAYVVWVDGTTARLLDRAGGGEIAFEVPPGSPADRDRVLALKVRSALAPHPRETPAPPVAALNLELSLAGALRFTGGPELEMGLAASVEVRPGLAGVIALGVAMPSFDAATGREVRFTQLALAAGARGRWPVTGGVQLDAQVDLALRRMSARGPNSSGKMKALGAAWLPALGASIGAQLGFFRAALSYDHALGERVVRRGGETIPIPPGGRVGLGVAYVVSFH